MKIETYITNYLTKSSKAIKDLIQACQPEIKEASLSIFNVYYKKGGTTFFFGNGGSASCAEHIAEELLNRLKDDRVPIASYALTSQPAILTGIANDYGFENVFSRQIEALATSKDLVVALSTSGNSENLIRAINLAKSRGIKTIGLTGKDGGRLAKIVDISVKVPSDDVGIIQECHTAIGHIICGIVEESLFGKEGFDYD